MHLQLPNAPGVYAIECTGNEKIYIGSAKDMQDRQWHHLSALRLGNHSNRKLQNSFNKYGEGSLYFYVIDFVDVARIAVEQYWITALDCFKRGFNMFPIARPGFHGQHSLASREKISERQKGKIPTEKQLAALKYGRSDKFKATRYASISKTLTGRKGSPWTAERRATGMSAETRAKIGMAFKGKPWSPARRAAWQNRFGGALQFA